MVEQNTSMTMAQKALDSQIEFDRQMAILDEKLNSKLYSAPSDFRSTLEPAIIDGRHHNKTLKKYATNLNVLALRGDLDKGIGRELELKQLVMILSKRKKANPILVGAAGIGKSQTAYDLAIMISDPEYKGPLLGKTIWEVSTTSLVAGCKYVGMSEERMQDLLDDATSDPNVILFWDEVHTMVGAGAGSKNNNDLANIVKPALAGKNLSIIGATTEDEYLIIQADKALSRRFNKITVHKLTDHQVLKVLQGIKSTYERHHGIMYDPDSLKLMPILSQKFSGLNDPDASIDLMDTSGAIKQNSPDRWTKGGNVVQPADIAEAAAMLYSENIETINEYLLHY